jgi:hypothetical protein
MECGHESLRQQMFRGVQTNLQRKDAKGQRRKEFKPRMTSRNGISLCLTFFATLILCVFALRLVLGIILVRAAPDWENENEERRTRTRTRSRSRSNAIVLPRTCPKNIVHEPCDPWTTGMRDTEPGAPHVIFLSAFRRTAWRGFRQAFRCQLRPRPRPRPPQWGHWAGPGRIPCRCSCRCRPG